MSGGLPAGSQVTFADMRLTRLALQDPQRCATVNEYASATGITVSRILELLSPVLSSGLVELEPIGGEIFVNTGPAGNRLAGLPANLWETLRRQRDEDTAFALWRLVRGLEHGGWDVETDASRIPVIDGHTTLLALKLRGDGRVPLLILPDAVELAGPASPLGRYESHGRQLVAVACRNGELDRMATSVRRWILSNPGRGQLHVLLLEAPRYQPVLLGGSDAAVAPRAVSRVSVDDLLD